MVSVIVGADGEIGSALYRILSDSYGDSVFGKDQGSCYTNKTSNIDTSEFLAEDFDEVFGLIEILHICIPWGDEFEEIVASYQETLSPQHTIIHSTVPIGTSRRCGAIHSPIIGRHPKMYESIRSFTKFIGGEHASEVADYFRGASLDVYITDKQETTELMKLDSTTWFGTLIEKTKDTKRLCEKHDVPFEFFTIWTDRYNEGQRKVGDDRYCRPNLVPIMTKISGHCVLPNAEMLRDDSSFAQIVSDLNGGGS